MAVTHGGDQANAGTQQPTAATPASWAELAVSDSDEAWLARTRVFLTPISAPSIMGLMGFMMATAAVGAWQAGWYGTGSTPMILWPLALFAGGLLQSIAAIASLRARDGVALAAHTAWGSFWLAWGVLQLLVATHVMAAVPLGTANPSFAFWFIVLTMVTISCTLAVAIKDMPLFITLGTLAAGSALTAAGFWSGSLGVTRAGGWLFVVSAAAAWFTATAMILENSYGRTILPLGKLSKRANVPGQQATRPVGRTAGMPGVRVGQ